MSINLGITYSAGISGDLTPIMYADTSYASDINDSKYITGDLMMINGEVTCKCPVPQQK
jgi:hypothetical protein